MASQPELQSEKFRRGLWLEEEDRRLTMFVTRMGLERSGKSCRFRWLNYLRPSLKRGSISSEEEQIILHLHKKWGNKWSKIARWLPGRTDNEIKNYWRSHMKKKFVNQQEAALTNSFEQTHEDHRLVEKKDEPLSNSHALLGFSNFGIATSPYEIRLSNWMAQLTNDDREVYHHEECNSLEFCFCYHHMYLTESGQRDYLWDSLVSLWDVA